MNVNTLFGNVKEIVIPSVKAANFWPKLGTKELDPTTAIESIINLVMVIVVVSAVIYIMFAGLQYITSSGDANKAKQALAGVTNAIIGLAVAFAAYILVSLVMKQLFGINDIGAPLDNLPKNEG